jgi:hypothetical protein
VKKRGESQFPPAGIVKARPGYDIYTGTSETPHAHVWRRQSAEDILAHHLTPEGIANRHRRREQYLRDQRGE